LIRQAQARRNEPRDVIGSCIAWVDHHPMNQIVINGRFLSRQHTGVDRFAIESIRALDELLVANDPALSRMSFEIVAPKQARAPTGLRRIEFSQVGRLQGHLWEQLELMRALKGRRLLNLCNTGPLLVRRQAVVIHDAATVRVPDAYTPAFRLSYRLLMPALGRRADSVMTVSDFSRRELDACWGIAAEGVDVVAEGGEHLLREPADTSVLERHGLRPDAYLLAVGSMAPHKNLLALLRAVSSPSELPIDLVIAGGSNSRIFSDVDFPVSTRVHRLGYISDRELRALYESALAFVFPSRYEGFGLPPLEAMACGCPVVSSSAASLPEVCGDAALMVDLHDPTALRQAIERIIAEPTLRESLRAAGLRRAAEFGWQRAALGIARRLSP
jgi:glycosyltransferase involved in cell wall biosynthesis